MMKPPGHCAARVGAVAVSMLLLSSATADSVTISPAKDNTLIENALGEVSNGIGNSIFSGRVGVLGGGALHRAVLAFDLSAIPPGSIIHSAALTLQLLQSVSGDQSMTLHRVLADWGEGRSEAFGGQGVPSQPDDATWIHTFFPDAFWTNIGGDFDATVSATQTVGFDNGPYTWSSPGLAADVQAWVDHPSMNFGWLVKGNESTLNSSKRFGSRNHESPELRPALVIDFTPPAVCPTDINGDHQVDRLDLDAVLAAWGLCADPCPPQCPADVDGDCAVNVRDLLAVINTWGTCR